MSWWRVFYCAEPHGVKLIQVTLRLWHINPFDHEEPCAAVIRCTADPKKVDKRTRSKWSRVLRYAISRKPDDEPLDRFVKRKGGINRCAERFRAYRRGRPSCKPDMD